MLKIFSRSYKSIAKRIVLPIGPILEPEDRGLLTSEPFWEIETPPEAPCAPAVAPLGPPAAPRGSPRGGSGTATALPCFFQDCLNVELTLA